MRASFVLILATMWTFFTTSRADAHGDLMHLGGTRERGGQIVIDPTFDFPLPVVVAPLIQLGGQIFYTGIIPSFAWVVEPTADLLFPLRSGTQVRFVLVSVDTGASVKIGGTTLDQPQESALIGTYSNDSAVHIHPEWQLTLPDGVVGSYVIRFKLTTTSTYDESPEYVLTLTNQAAPTTTPTLEPQATPTASVTVSPTRSPTPSRTVPVPSPTATSTSTADPTHTPTPSASASHTSTTTPSPTPTPSRTPRSPAADASCDRRVSVADVVAVQLAQLEPLALLCDADVNGDGRVDSVDLELVLANLFGGTAR